MKTLLLSVACLLSTATGHEAVFKYIGCVKDSGDRLFKGTNPSSPNQNRGLCVETCKARHFRYAGVQYGDQCFCGNHKPSTGHFTDEAECNMACKGNATQMCGGTWRMNVFQTGLPAQVQEEITYKYIRCVKDSGDRLFKGFNKNLPSQSHEVCVAICKARFFRYAGVQYGDQCFCGNTEPSSEHFAAEEECNMKCKGNPAQMCGGNWRMGVFETGPTGPEPAYSHVGCVRDIGTRLMKGHRGEYPEILTPRFCIQECIDRGFPFAGVQYGRWCYCDFHKPPLEHYVGQEECNEKCQGNHLLMCGGDFRMDVFEIGTSGRNQNHGNAVDQNSIQKDCKLPDYPENIYELFQCSAAGPESAPRPGDTVDSGRLVMISCVDQFEITGRGFAICRNGVWNQKIPRCSKPCPPIIPTTVHYLECHQGGRLVDCNQTFASNSQVTVACPPLLDVRTAPTDLEEKIDLTCGQDGRWSHPLPTCNLP